MKYGRNDLCPCGSGKKFKKCHEGRMEDLAVQQMKEKAIEVIKEQLDFYTSSDLINRFPNSKDKIKEMSDYVEKISSNPQANRSPNCLNNNGQIYERIHNFGRIKVDVKRENFPFCYAWSIEALKEIKGDHNLQTEFFELKELIEFVSTDLLDTNFLNSNNISNDPVFVIEYHQAKEREKWTVDGNHRIASAYKKNINGKIEGYYFSPDLHVKALMYDYMKLFYVIRTNLNRMVEYERLEEEIPELLSMNLVD